METYIKNLENRLSQDLQEIQNSKSKFGIVDLITYIGGIWFFLTQILMGPFFKNFVSRRLFVAEIGMNLLYKLSSDNNIVPKSRVKIDVQNPNSTRDYEELPNVSDRSLNQKNPDIELEGGEPSKPTEFFKNVIYDPFINSR